MGQPVARQGDLVITACLHQVQGQPNPPGPPVVAPVSHPFSATLDQQLSQKVKIDGKFVVLQGSAGLAKGHVALSPPGTVPPASFVKPPNNRAEVMRGSGTVKIEGKPVARIGDPVQTCSELPPPHGTIAPGPGTPTQVLVGG
ncbi:PAAR domain-containing protein [Nodosilinea sp. FACHB-131]|uniref:PAAR domain-containing protein n=1 Tax=Cyanophyceae TaxID=3028117 RepID=UPI00168353DE|nr:PAAR domain-containing protein [Nodosilinea sp. FACHB-131]MBD1873791.1 PAAR domain-containing protein [Nodosilinea sp. FACHB-131]